MIDRNTFYGADKSQTLIASPQVSDTFQGAKYQSGSPITLNVGVARLWIFSGLGGFTVNLPAANGDTQKCGRLGGPIFCLINLPSGSTITLKDADGTTLESILINKAVVIGLADNSTTAGKWIRHIQDVA